MEGLLTEATSSKNGLMPFKHYKQVAANIGIALANSNSDACIVTFSGKWSAFLGVTKNANISQCLIWLAGGDYGTGAVKKKLIAPSSLPYGINVYSNNSNKNKILITGLDQWSQITALMITGEATTFEELSSSSVSLLDYTEIDIS